MKRKIVAILAADVAGYTRLVSADEEETLGRLSSYRSVFAEAIGRYGGRIFNTAGDAILAEFSSAVEAARAALDIQGSIAERNRALPLARQMSFRIGITIGDVVENESGDLLGEGVNIAARLESIAPAGGICISRTAHEAVANKLKVTFGDIGPQSLKNIPGRVHAYVYSPGQASAAAQSSAPAGQWLERLKPLAQRLSPQTWAGAAALAVVAVTLLSWLDREPDERAAEVAALAPATQADAVQTDYAGVTTLGDDPAQSEGTALEAGDDEPGTAVPPAKRPLSDPLTEHLVLKRQWQDCQEAVPAKKVAACVALIDSGRFSGDDLALILMNYGRALREAGESEKAAAAYAESIRIAPSADAYNNRGILHYDKKDWEKAIADYSAAVRLDPRHGEAHNNRAWTQFKAGQARAALADANKAVQLLSSEAYVWDTRGHINEALGHRDAAVRDYRNALSIDPASKASRAGLKRLGAAQ